MVKLVGPHSETESAVTLLCSCGSGQGPSPMKAFRTITGANLASGLPKLVRSMNAGGVSEYEFDGWG